MNNVKSVFSIKDLENLSGIKAHTIRMWEKRYNVLTPMRTDTNIRYYDVTNLQKLLNITLLHRHGYKISKISRFPADRIPALVNDIISSKSAKLHAINAFKMAMMNFDQKLFFETYDNLLSEKSFREVFYEVFIPLMDEIGLLWQTSTITPAHEHFISYLVKLKLLTNTDRIHSGNALKHDRVFVLFLPLNEIHELGLMYINYEIVKSGYKSIYLGESTPTENLKDIVRYFDNITFISYFTVEPAASEVDNYIADLIENVLSEDSKLWLIGKNCGHINTAELPQNTTVFNSIPLLIEEII